MRVRHERAHIDVHVHMVVVFACHDTGWGLGQHAHMRASGLVMMMWTMVCTRAIITMCKIFIDVCTCE